MQLPQSSLTLWNAEDVRFGSFKVPNIGLYLTLAFLASVALLAAGVALYFVKKKKWLLIVSVLYNLCLQAVILCLQAASSPVFLTDTATVFLILGLAVSVAELICLALTKMPQRQENSAEEENETIAQIEQKVTELPPKRARIYKIIMLALDCLATLLLVLIFFFPLYSDEGVSFSLIGTLANSGYPVTLYLLFVVMFVAFFAMLARFAVAVSAFFTSDNTYIVKSQRYIFGVAIYALIFCIAGFCITFYYKISGSETVKTSVAGFVSFFCAFGLLVGHSALFGLMGGKETRKEKALRLKAEPLLYVTLLTAITFLSLVFNLVDVSLNAMGYNVQHITLSGYQLLSTYGTLAGGFQVIAFLLFSFLLMSGVMFGLCLVSFFTKSSDFYKLVKTTAVMNTVFVGLIGLFGVYFDIAQQINVENIESLVSQYGFSLGLEYEVKSSCIYVLAASLIVIAVMLVRKQFSLAPDPTFELTLPEGAEESLASVGAAQGGFGDVAEERNFDACPAFTELDGKIPQFQQDLAERRQQLFEGLSLPSLVRFVVDYARDSRLHLSYTAEDIATFVAGLGASRLTILQGMSGTGKTSLPKIFCEALLGNCEIVEVESSWRDKNELLGYYNEFSRCFTPKKFTQCLYKARLNAEIPTLIVLDEMNLSRIEYYFSDFLSLMEHEEDKRSIKLLNIKLHRRERGQSFDYSGLTDGHTVKIPPNVWFIGTANRDESTFEISDKVYDRAQTMNFNKRAPKVRSFGEPRQQRFVPYEELNGLFLQAKSSGQFEAEENTTIQRVEKLLSPYNISFGNRILNQMETFVKIYCACFVDKASAVDEAVEKILFSKVVSKLETKVVENKEALAAEFDKLGLETCSAFIRKLNED